MSDGIVYEQQTNEVIPLNCNFTEIPIRDIDDITGNNPRTVLGWWRTTKSDHYHIFECGDRATGQFLSVGREYDILACRTGNSPSTNDCSNISITNIDIAWEHDKWHHFAYVWDTPNHILYYDGSLYVNVTVTGIVTTANTSCVLGSRDPGLSFKGDIQRLQVYKKALQPPEIKRKYDGIFYFYIISQKLLS